MVHGNERIAAHKFDCFESGEKEEQMARFSEKFLLGAATAAHQVEGNNIHSDYWIQEHLKHSQFSEPSGAAVDHYNRYQEDILLLKEAGLNAYRFSIEWARIEPEEGSFDQEELDHYIEMIDFCLAQGVEPVVTLHHFSSPAWLIRQGGWEDEKTVGRFERYVRYVLPALAGKVRYICTINEANMRIQLEALMKDMMQRMRHAAMTNKEKAESMQKKAGDVQVGINMQSDMMAAAMDSAAAFGFQDPRKVATFVSPGSTAGDLIVMKAHLAAKKVIRELAPEIKVGLTLSLHDLQAYPGGEAYAETEWADEFLHYLPFIEEDDFLGCQCYTRKCFDESGSVDAKDAVSFTQMGYENYPKAIGNVLARVAEKFHGDLIVTENGIATEDDAVRRVYIDRATESVAACIARGLPVKGYFYWSLLDNFEWQRGFAMTFGLIAVDRKNGFARHPKESLAYLGSLRS